jgi:EAL domain-containing protein (putative c-di-GMP-specific phosphodiesterase class I)
VQLETGRIRGFEALLRWQQPDIGLVSPLQFIPLAEETGLILPIGDWVLHQACTDTARLHREGHSDLSVSVNLSPIQFRQADLKDRIARILADTGFPPAMLELEITEGALMDDMKGALETLHELRDLGLKISIDDFGTGYSSLNYLKTFPFDTLKIDKTFVHDMLIDAQNETIVATMISLGHSLGLRVIAEGVENTHHLERLAQYQCDQIQGFFFSRPIPFADLEDLLASGRALPLSVSGH